MGRPDVLKAIFECNRVSPYTIIHSFSLYMSLVTPNFKLGFALFGVLAIVVLEPTWESFWSRVSRVRRCHGSRVVKGDRTTGQSAAGVDLGYLTN